MLEDFLIFLFIVVGFGGAVGLYRLCWRWYRFWRLLMICFWMFVVSSAGGMTTRLLFNDLARGVAFSRVFTGALIVYGIYAFTLFAQGQRRREQAMKEEEAT